MLAATDESSTRPPMAVAPEDVALEAVPARRVATRVAGDGAAAAASYERIADRYEAMAAAAAEAGDLVRATNQRQVAATYRSIAAGLTRVRD
jgi:hypothetical protein